VLAHDCLDGAIGKVHGEPEDCDDLEAEYAAASLTRAIDPACLVGCNIDVESLGSGWVTALHKEACFTNHTVMYADGTDGIIRLDNKVNGGHRFRFIGMRPTVAYNLPSRFSWAKPLASVLQADRRGVEKALMGFLQPVETTEVSGTELQALKKCPVLLTLRRQDALAEKKANEANNSEPDCSCEVLQIPRVVALFANPKDQRHKLQLGLEERTILKSGLMPYTADLCPSAQVSDLQEKLVERRPQILHLSGHANGGVFCFENQRGRSVFTSALHLERVLGEHSVNNTGANGCLECVFINTCDSLATGNRLHHEHRIPYVICWEGQVDDRQATYLCGNFYRNLKEGMSYRRAFSRASCMSPTPLSTSPAKSHRQDGSLTDGTHSNKQASKAASSCVNSASSCVKGRPHLLVNDQYEEMTAGAPCRCGLQPSQLRDGQQVVLECGSGVLTVDGYRLRALKVTGNSRSSYQVPDGAVWVVKRGKKGKADGEGVVRLSLRNKDVDRYMGSNAMGEVECRVSWCKKREQLFFSETDSRLGHVLIGTRNTSDAFLMCNPEGDNAIQTPDKSAATPWIIRAAAAPLQ
jgi:hypothetical protein